jgi:hypothetical protein
MNLARTFYEKGVRLFAKFCALAKTLRKRQRLLLEAFGLVGSPFRQAGDGVPSGLMRLGFGPLEHALLDGKGLAGLVDFPKPGRLATASASRPNTHDIAGVIIFLIIAHVANMARFSGGQQID